MRGLTDHSLEAVPFSFLPSRKRSPSGKRAPTGCNATLEITQWRERCGAQATIALHIFKYAACCGGVVKLPANPCLNATASCFGFPRTAACPRVRSPFHADMMGFFYVQVPSLCYELGDARAAMRLARAHKRYGQYAGGSTRSCASSDDAAYAHVRSGDLFRRRHFSWWAYQQPPLSYFTNAWAHSNKTSLVVVAEDRANPVVGALERLPGVRVSVSADAQAHGTLLRCASTLILSNSNYGKMEFHRNRRVTDLYLWTWKHDVVFADLSRHQLMSRRCGTRAHLFGTGADDMAKRGKWDGTRNETRALLLRERTRYERSLEVPCDRRADEEEMGDEDDDDDDDGDDP